MIQAGTLLLLPGVLLRRNLWKGDKTQDSRGKARCKKAGPGNVGCIRPGLMWDLVLLGLGASRCWVGRSLLLFPWSEVTDEWARMIAAAAASASASEGFGDKGPLDE